MNRINPSLSSGSEESSERVLAVNATVAWVDSNSCGRGPILGDDCILDISESKWSQNAGTRHVLRHGLR